MNESALRLFHSIAFRLHNTVKRPKRPYSQAPDGGGNTRFAPERDSLGIREKAWINPRLLDLPRLQFNIVRVKRCNAQQEFSEI